MASKKLTDLTGMAAVPANNDLIYIVDVSAPSDAGKSLKIERSTFLGATYLTTPLTSTDWDGDAKSDAGPTKLDMSAVFTGYPDMAVKAVLLRIYARDSAPIGTPGLYFRVGPSATYYYALQVNPPGGDLVSSNTGICPCDANGDIYYKIHASGSGTCACWLDVWGYWV